MMPLLAMAAAGAISACIALGGDSDRILARDLAPAFPALAQAKGDAPVGYAPVPGAHRIFRAAELRRIALRLGVEAQPEGDVCFERTTEAPDAARMLEAMRRALPGARIEILEISRQPVPPGEMQFPAAGLKKTSAGAFWKGQVLYAGGRRFATWARVSVSVSAPRVVSAQELNPGRAIEAAALRVETGPYFPEPGEFAVSVEDVAGKMPRRVIRPGSPILLQWLVAPPAVEHGDAVQVEVRAGTARLKLDARAERAGAVGDAIPVRNPVSGKLFSARVEGKGKVSVDRGDL